MVQWDISLKYDAFVLQGVVKTHGLLYSWCTDSLFHHFKVFNTIFHYSGKKFCHKATWTKNGPMPVKFVYPPLSDCFEVSKSAQPLLN